MQAAALDLTALLDPCATAGAGLAPASAGISPALVVRVRAEYADMPGLRLTVVQAARLFGVAPGVAHAVLEDLRRASVLTCSARGMYALVR